MSNTTVQAALVSLSFKYGKQGGTDKEITKRICAENEASDKSLKASKRTICKEAFDPLKKMARGVPLQAVQPREGHCPS